MQNLKYKKDYLIDWINSLEISEEAIFVTNIEDLYNGKVILDIIYLLSDGNLKLSENLSLLENIKNIMKINYNYDLNINTNNNDDFNLEILNLLDFLKNKYDNNYKLINSNKLSCFNNNNNKENLNILKNKNLNNNSFSIKNTKENNIYNFKISHKNNINITPLDYKIRQKDNIINPLNVNNYKINNYDKNNINIKNNNILNTGNSLEKNISSFNNNIFNSNISKYSFPNFNLNLLIGCPKIYTDNWNFDFFKFYKYTFPISYIDNSNYKTLSLDFKLNNNNNKSKKQNHLKKLKINFILSILFDLKLIRETQKNEEYLYNNFLNNCYNGVLIAKIINILEGKKDKVLKGINEESFYNININLNWKKIFEFLLEKNNFKKLNFFKEENFYLDKNKLLDFIYELMLYYNKNRIYVYDDINRRKIEKQNNLIKSNEDFLLQLNNQEKDFLNSKNIKNKNSKKKIPKFKPKINNLSKINKSALINSHNIMDNINNLLEINKLENKFKNTKLKNKSNKNIYITYDPNNINILSYKNYNDDQNKEDLISKRKFLLNEYINFDIKNNTYESKNSNIHKLNAKQTKKENNKNNYNVSEDKNSTINNVKNLDFDYINLDNLINVPYYNENKLYDFEVKEILDYLNLIGIDSNVLNFYNKEMIAFKDGTLLYSILYILEKEKNILPEINFEANNSNEEINNLRLIINFLYKNKKHFSLKFLNKERELYKANPIFILKLLKNIKLIYENEKN